MNCKNLNLIDIFLTGISFGGWQWRDFVPDVRDVDAEFGFRVAPDGEGVVLHRQEVRQIQVLVVAHLKMVVDLPAKVGLNACECVV